MSDLLKQYEKVVFSHVSLERALAEVERGLAPGLPPQIILLLGPTGVGKTTLVEALRSSPDGPVVKMTCLPVTGKRGFDFGKTHWALLARRLCGAFPDDHVSPDAVAARLRSGIVRRDGAATADEYRLGVLEMLREKGARAVVLDEAQHMTRVPSARSQADQLDVIKDCMDRTGIPHILAGTYELSPMVAPGDQLGRRSLKVHFPPYRSSVASDLAAFQTIFGQLVSGLPVLGPDRSWLELRDHLSDIFVGCAGCVGTLKDWLSRSLHMALLTKAEFLTWPLMEQTRLPNEALLAIAQEIRAYRDAKTPTWGEIELELGVHRELQPGGAQRKSATSRKPGKRSPKRDAVGASASRP